MVRDLEPTSDRLISRCEILNYNCETSSFYVRELWPPLLPPAPPCWAVMLPDPLTMALATPWAKTCFPPITLETEGLPLATRICPLLIATCFTEDWSAELTGIPNIFKGKKYQISFMNHSLLNYWVNEACKMFGVIQSQRSSDLASRGPCGLSGPFLARHGDHVTSFHCNKLVGRSSSGLLLAGYCGNHLLLLCWNFPGLLLDNNLQRDIERDGNRTTTLPINHRRPRY